VFNDTHTHTCVCVRVCVCGLTYPNMFKEVYFTYICSKEGVAVNLQQEERL